jgi:hypothetical protein
MTIELPASVEQELRTTAVKQGRDVETLVLEAIRCYLEAEAITDLSAETVAEAQLALVGELSTVDGWEHGGR